MKFLEKEFPKGTFKGQKSDGGSIHNALANNLDIFARKINDDMHFLIIISGNDMVGNGKSTLKTHVGSYLTWKINQLHGTDNTYTAENEFFTANDLMKGSPKLPRLSVVSLDEGDDLTTHGMKELAVRLKRYFRKCRQLNQIVILILPSFFELPKFFALSRSHCLINVKFKGEFDRGYFDFYGMRHKKLLYIKGKKEWDYDAYQSNFEGVFAPNYYFFPNVEEETKRYLEKKHQDMIDDAEEQEEQLSVKEQLRRQTIKYFNSMHNHFPKLLVKDLCLAFGISSSAATRYFKKNVENHKDGSFQNPKPSPEYNNILCKQGDDEAAQIGSAETKQEEVINNEDKD